MTIRVSVRPEGNLWVIDIEGWGVTQVENLDDVEAAVKDYIECMRACDPRHKDDAE